MSWINIGVAIISAVATTATAVYSADQQKTAAKRSRKDADDARVAAADLGNLDEGEAQSASKKLFRQGLYFTSPTGLNSGSGTRGRSRLMGT